MLRRVLVVTGWVPVAAALVTFSACDRGAFEEHAAPVIERSCASTRCHGVMDGESLPEEGFFVHVTEHGRLAELEAARRRALERVTTTAAPHLSSLIRVPLSRTHGGGPHVGGDVFASPEHDGARALARWIETEREGSGGEDVELSELETRFASDVLPGLVARCGIAGCHGPDDVANTALPAVRDPSSGQFAPLQVRSTRRVVRKLVDLWGSDVRRSRLFRKLLGGVSGLRHRGGPGTFFPEAPIDEPLGTPELERVLAWARAERRAIGVEEGRAPRGIVVVREPPQTRAPYRIEAGLAGADLLWLAWPPGTAEPEVLTSLLSEVLGAGPLELRDPAVAHDGRTVVVAARVEDSSTFVLVEIDLDARTARRATSPGALGSFTSPVFGPDGRLVAVWDGHGEPGRDGAGAPPELVAFDADGQMERLTWTLAPEVRPGVLASSKTRGMIIFATRRSGEEGTEGVLFRFPTCHDPTLHGEPEYHVQFGASVAPDAPYLARDLPDGRQIVTVLESTEVSDDRGALAVLDRSLGPFPRGGEASIPQPIEALVTLDATRRWRDPAVLPDGRVIVSSDAGRGEGEDALVVVTIADGPSGPTLAMREVLAEAAGVGFRGAAVVLPRPVEDDDHAAVIDGGSPTARIALRDATVLEALYGRPEPSGARSLRDDIAAVRALVAVDAEGASGRGARVLGEVSLAADHSAELEIPARTPILLQLLDERGMMVGRQLDRWYYGEGDELVPAGTNAEAYASACAGCHGPLSGRPEDLASRPPDVLSSASVTLSTHADRDRRRPLPPTDLASRAPLDASFVTLVAPLLATRCERCHGTESPAGGLALAPGDGVRFAAAYEALLDGRVDLDGRARRSALVERVLGEELEADGSPDGRCPPEGLTEEELRDLCRWIEAGASYAEVPRDR